MIKRLLIANRGEIAVRIIRTAKDMNIQTIAVYSDADRTACHVQAADEAYYLGPAAASQSYLVGDKIIDICLKYKIDAIHPGYGFLSENADFAEKAEKAGIIFIGPSAYAMNKMGDKLSAKETARLHNVPLVPGTDYAIKDVNEARNIANKIGYPVLIKASAGGGGKGMRIVNNDEEFAPAVTRAMSEAQSAFGDSSVFIERYVEKPRHIEIQIMADNHGNVVYLFERECSVQRRHQKVVEEAPSTILTPEMRKQMGESAIALAKAVNYSGAGTIEFLVDASLNYYFLEMNTRLQVEHPVTELITGLDLVREQINVAQGLPLSFKQEDLKIIGHAIEIRVYAEDPNNDFLPDIGTLSTYKIPKGVGVRVDDGYEQGMEIPIYYDPMIAKLVTYGRNREEARQRMIRAIAEYTITGIETTLSFGTFVMNHEAFIQGQYDTHFVKNYFTKNSDKKLNTDAETIAAIFAAFQKHTLTAPLQTTVHSQSTNTNSAWRINRGF